MSKINLNTFGGSDYNEYTEEGFMKAFPEAEYNILSEDALSKFDNDIQSALKKAASGSISQEVVDSIEKAQRDRSKLVLVTITRKDGRVTKKWVKPKEGDKALMKHPNYDAKDLADLRGRGFSDEKIKQRWDAEHQRMSPKKAEAHDAKGGKAIEKDATNNSLSKYWYKDGVHPMNIVRSRMDKKSLIDMVGSGNKAAIESLKKRGQTVRVLDKGGLAIEIKANSGDSYNAKLVKNPDNEKAINAFRNSGDKEAVAKVEGKYNPKTRETSGSKNKKPSEQQNIIDNIKGIRAGQKISIPPDDVKTIEGMAGSLSVGKSFSIGGYNLVVVAPDESRSGSWYVSKVKKDKDKSAVAKVEEKYNPKTRETSGSKNKKPSEQQNIIDNIKGIRAGQKISIPPDDVKTIEGMAGSLSVGKSFSIGGYNLVVVAPDESRSGSWYVSKVKKDKDKSAVAKVEEKYNPKTRETSGSKNKKALAELNRVKEYVDSNPDITDVTDIKTSNGLSWFNFTDKKTGMQMEAYADESKFRVTHTDLSDKKSIRSVDDLKDKLGDTGKDDNIGVAEFIEKNGIDKLNNLKSGAEDRWWENYDKAIARLKRDEAKKMVSSGEYRSIKEAREELDDEDFHDDATDYAHSETDKWIKNGK